MLLGSFIIFPISNLNFISKVLERVLYSRFCSHLDSFPSLSLFQSAYRKFYSTETALIRIHNDLCRAMNLQRISALILLDLSAAFDTIDHNILLSRLNSCFGISNTAQSLLASYLSQRSQSVAIVKHFLQVFYSFAAFRKDLYLVHCFSLCIPPL